MGGENEKAQLGGAPFQKIFQAECEQILKRRRARAEEDEDSLPSGSEAVEDDLVGLALSGGGIRSATFALGVLEGLKEHDLLRRVDYLSTVSGGGYIGAWLSGNCLRAADPTSKERDAASTQGGRCAKAVNWARDLFVGKEKQANTDPHVSPTTTPGVDWLSRDTPWEKSIAHLRRYSNYLAPDFGFFSADTWTMVTVWLRNTLLIQAMVVLAVAALMLSPRLVYSLVFTHWPAVDQGRWLAVGLFTLAIVGIAGSQRSLIEGEKVWQRNKNWFKGLLLGVVLLSLTIGFIRYFHFNPFGKESIRKWDVWQPFAVATMAVLAGICLMPLGVAIANLVSQRLPQHRPLKRVDYTQAWAQFLVIGPMLVTAILVASILWAKTAAPLGETPGHLHDVYSHLHSLKSYSEFFLQAWYYWPLPLCVAFISLWILSISAIRAWTCGWLAVAVLAPIPAVVALHALLSAIMLLLHGWIEPAALVPEGQWRAFVWAPGLLLTAFALTIIVLLGMLGRASIEAVREWWSRLAAWMLIYSVAWTAISTIAIYGPYWIEQLTLDSYGRSFSIGWIVTTVGGLLAGNSGRTGDASRTGSQQKTMINRALELFTMAAPFIFIVGMLFTISMVVHYLVTQLFARFEPAANASWVSVLFDLREAHWTLLNSVNLSQLAAVLAVVLGCLLLLSFRVDINEFGLNAFYRSRLVRCYLGATRDPKQRKPQNFTGFDDNDDVPMEKLRDTRGPVHLVNCALNLGGSSDLTVHTRHSASFVITPHAIGSCYQSKDSTGNATAIGFTDLARITDDTYGTTTLGQAISVSGAAASPNQGFHTAPAVAFLLTVFNARLGWWFPNPLHRRRAPSPRFGLPYLTRELFGLAHERKWFVMISDGGHFENLGVYELIRRKCKVIVVSDAECDPNYQFEGLGKLIRMCEVDADLQATIEIDVRDIRPDRQTLLSKAQYAVGKITYRGSPEKTGTLVYIKASISGDEDTSIAQYRDTHPTFPHESTGNQFYSEDQFESYRRLGKHAVNRLVSGVPANVATVFTEGCCSPGT